MAAINFPNSPQTNATHTVGSLNYVYDGVKWIGGGNSPVDKIYEDDSKVEIVDTGGSSGYFIVSPEGSEAFRVNSAGKLLFNNIGGSVIGGQSSAGTLTLYGGATNQGGQIDLYGGNNTSGIITFRTGAGSGQQTERLRIKSNGDLKHTGLRAGGGDNKLAILVTPSHNTNEEDVIVYQVENESSFNQITFGGGNSSYNAATKLVFKTASAVDTTDGTERLCITSDGGVLIGGHITAVDSGNAPNIEIVNTSTSTLTLARNDTSISSGHDIAAIRVWGNDSNGTYQQCAEILAEADGDHGTDDKPTALSFKVTADGASSPTERLRITSGGNVLFGNYFTSKEIGSFESALQIQGTTGNTSSMSIFRYSDDAGGPNITLGKGRGSAGDVDKPDDGDTIGAIRFQIANNNNLTDGESAKIEAVVDADPGGGDYPSRLCFFTAADGENSVTERLRITSGGTLTITPADTTSDYATTDGGIDIAQTINSTGTSSSQSIGLSFNLNKSGETGAIAEIGAIREGSGLSGLVFRTRDNSTGRNERLRITSDGDIGIGTDSPETKLHVEGTGNESITLKLKQGTTAGNYSSLQVGRTDGAGTQHITDAVTGGIPISGIPGILLGSSNAGVPAVSIQSANSANGHIVFSPKGSEKVRITSDGDVGIGVIEPGYKLEVNGSFAATTKSFVIDHPTKPEMKLRYGSLEGPENGVYVRGKTTEFIIELPDYWTGLVDEESITVNLTAIGEVQTLYVKNIKDNKVFVGSKYENIEYFYTIFGERKDVEKLEVEF